ncbi:TPA: hypothetical protein ACYSI4_002856 [Citrobacter werkmanii]|uniref:hypothetical protein n=1 Tax=Citrobacter werkmanii TaxID=67827 RepID=UPI00300CFA25|nr:hypothetical protein [Citrobacter braakii]
MKRLMLAFAATTILAGCGSHYDEEEALARSAAAQAAKEQHNITAYGFKSVLNAWNCTNANGSGESILAVRGMTNDERGQDMPLMITRAGVKTLYKYDAGMGDGVLYLTDPNGESKHLARFKWGAYADSYDILALRDTGVESEFHCNQIKDPSLN